MHCFQTKSLVRLGTWFCGAIFALCSVATAAPPWETLAPFRRIDADPNNSYPIAETNGPWMIIATTFRGDQAEKQAQELVYELRRKHKLPAYTFKREFDFTGKERGKGFNKYGGPKMMRYQTGEVIEEVAVVVGDYDTVDDPRAERALQKIKYLQPDSLSKEKGKGTSQSLSSLRQFYRNATSAKEERPKGPMGHAFIATNPLLPKEYFVSSGVDRFVAEINEGVKYSLLDCPGKYTMQVATFSGAALVDPKRIKEVEKGRPLESRLAEAAEKSHQLTEKLRAQGWEAYEFHDRDKSLVCIGSFDRLGVEHPDGRLEPDPQIRKIVEIFSAAPGVSKEDGQLKPELKPRKIDGIEFDIEPRPLEVPKRSLSTAYQRSLRSDL